MSLLQAIATGASLLFGSSANGKGIVTEVSDAVDKWVPSDATRHTQNIENQQAGDASQASARSMLLPTHDSWFDVFVDGLNRMVRPVITYWVVGGLMGFWSLQPPGNIQPIVWNIVWTVVGFWFGSRMLFKDVPAVMRVYYNTKAEVAERKTTKKSEPPKEDWADED